MNQTKLLFPLIFISLEDEPWEPIEPNPNAADHTHTTGYAFVLVDGSSSLFITFDGFYTAGAFTWTFFMGDGIVRTDCFASSAVDAFVLIDK